MRHPRRLALLLIVALVATMSSLGASAARATTPTICVALVVDGRAAGAEVSTGCVTVPKGATGVDVLQAGHHSVGFRSDGLICTIDGMPESGCSGVDDSHYWAYFHRAPGATSWTYSTEGAGTYQPLNASTEGWVYDDGSARTPENVPYQQICHPATRSPKPSASPSPKSTRVRHAAHHHHAQPHPTQQASRPPGTPSASTSPSAATTGAPTRHDRGGRGRGKRPHSEPHRATPTPTPTPTPSIRASNVAGVAPPSAASGGGASIGLLAGIAVVVGIGAAAAIRYRRGSS